jgi:hypothetical protein
MTARTSGPDADEIRFGVLGVALSIAQALANRDPHFMVELKSTTEQMANWMESQGHSDAATLFVREFSRSLHDKTFFPRPGQ